jgi:nucleotide-binding universal stress UspA family protein
MIMRILLAIDGSPYSDAAVAEVGRRPWPSGSEVRVITVDPKVDSNLLGGGSPTVFDELVQRQRTDAHRRLHAAVQVLNQASPELKVTYLMREGWPKEAILDEAEHWGADLVVVGSHGYGSIRRLFLGSVSLAVAINASCSVEIVRRSTPASHCEG